jgi:hypothetical protein
LARLAARMGIRKPVQTLISSIADAPSMVGWLRPVILIPAATAAGLTPQQLESILAHELAHIRRHDYLVNLGQTLVETLLFYHPAIWWASRQIRRERELCCDDLAVLVVGDALSYARALTVLEKTRAVTPGLAMGSTRGPLLERIQRLVSPNGRDHRPSKWAGVVVLLLLGLSAFILVKTWVPEAASVEELLSGSQQRTPAPRDMKFFASAFLNKELANAKAAIEEAQHRLQEYSRAKGGLFPDIDERRNAENTRLTALQSARTAAQIEGLEKSAVMEVAMEGIGREVSTPTLEGLRREDARLAITMAADSPLRQQILAQIEVAEQELVRNSHATIQRAEAEQRMALAKERMLTKELEAQRQRMHQLGQEWNQYQILVREVESQQEIYDSLLKRIQEEKLAQSLDASR